MRSRRAGQAATADASSTAAGLLILTTDRPLVHYLIMAVKTIILQKNMIYRSRFLSDEMSGGLNGCFLANEA